MFWHTCVPANRRGSDRALWGEVWGGKGLDDWQSILTVDVWGKRHKGKDTERHAETRWHRMANKRHMMSSTVWTWHTNSLSVSGIHNVSPVFIIKLMHCYAWYLVCGDTVVQVQAFKHRWRLSHIRLTEQNVHICNNSYTQLTLFYAADLILKMFLGINKGHHIYIMCYWIYLRHWTSNKWLNKI